MRLAPERTAAIHGLLDNIAEHVAAARKAPDTGAARKAIEPVWFLLHDFYAALGDAENTALRAALARLEKAA